MQICLLVVIGMTGKEMTKMEGDLVAKKQKKHKKGNKKERKNGDKILCVCLMHPKCSHVYSTSDAQVTSYTQNTIISPYSLHPTLHSFPLQPFIITATRIVQ